MTRKNTKKPLASGSGVRSAKDLSNASLLAYFRDMSATPLLLPHLDRHGVAANERVSVDGQTIQVALGIALLEAGFVQLEPAYQVLLAIAVHISGVTARLALLATSASTQVARSPPG